MATIFDRTHFQTRNQLRQILAGAAAKNELDQIYWFVEAKLPGAMTSSGRPQLQASSWPGRWVPLVAVGQDPETSRHYAELLLTCFKLSNPGIEFGLGLTAADLAQQYHCYEWGEPRWDNVCVICGSVMVSTTVGEELCDDCIDRLQQRR